MFPLDNLDWLKDVEELCIILKDKLYGIFVDSFVVRSYSEGNSELSDFFWLKCQHFYYFFYGEKCSEVIFDEKLSSLPLIICTIFFKKKHFSILGKINDLGHFEQIVAQKDFFLVPRDLVWLHFHTFFKKHISEILSADIAQNTNLEQRSTGKQHYWSGYLVDTLLFSVSCHSYSYFH